MEDSKVELSREELLLRYKKGPANKSDIKERRSPFKFLDSYDVNDSDIFFGRDNEIEELLRHYHSFGNVLIYGESGSGKSSLVQCGLRGRIPESDALFIPLRIRKEGLPGICRDICEYTSTQLDEEIEYSPEMSFTDALIEAREVASRPLVLFFDQFEELLIFHQSEIRNQFAEEFAKVANSKLNVKILIGIRQDFLAQLTELEDILEGLFDNRFWLRRMSRENASKAVVDACSTCDVKIDFQLAESIVARLDTSGQGIELPYLQVVMDRLYRQAVATNSDRPLISQSDVEKLGDVAKILATFLEEEVEKLPSPEIGRQILKGFVSREGTRRSLTREAAMREAEGFGTTITSDQLEGVINQLVKVRILRENSDAGLYELRHDSLAESVFNWISEIEKELLDVRDNLVNRFNEYSARGNAKTALLDQGFMEYVSVYKKRLHPLLNKPERDYLAASEIGLGRRKRLKQISIIGGIFAALFVCFLFVSGILWTRMKSAEQVALAEKQKFEEARQTVDQFFVTVSEDTLLNQPGAQGLRKDLLSKAKGFFEKYLNKLGDVSNDPNLQIDKARTTYYLGQIAREEKDGLNKSLVKFKDALKIQSRIAEGNELDEKTKYEELLYDLGNTLNALGIVYDDRNERQNAEEQYKNALEKRKELVGLNPKAEYRLKLASTKMNLAVLDGDKALAEKNISDCKLATKKLQDAQIEREVLQDELKKRQENLEDQSTISTENEVELTSNTNVLYKVQRDIAKGYWSLGKFVIRMYNVLDSDEVDDPKEAQAIDEYPYYKNAIKSYTAAIKACDAAQQTKPNAFEIQFVKGECYRGLSDTYESDTRTESENPDEKKQAYKDRLKKQLDQLDKATALFEDLKKLNPKVESYRVSIGRVARYRGWALTAYIENLIDEDLNDKDLVEKKKQAHENYSKAIAIYTEFTDNKAIIADLDSVKDELKDLDGLKLENSNQPKKAP